MAIRHLPNIRSVHLDSEARGVNTDRYKKILLLGYTSNDTTSDAGTLALPVGDVYEVTDEATARNLTLNHDGTPSELTEALYEIWDAAGSTVPISIYRLGQVYSYEGKFCNVEVSDDYTVTGFSSEGGTVTSFEDATLLTAEDRYDDLEDAYGFASGSTSALEDYDFDIVVPLEAYIDDSIETGNKDFGYLTALFCYKKSLYVNEISGVLPVHTALEYAYKSDTSVNYRTGTPTMSQLVAWKSYLINESGTNWGVGNFDPKNPGSLTTNFDEDTTDDPPSNHAYFLNESETPVPTKYDSAAKDDDGVPIDLGAYIMVVAANARFNNNVARQLYPTYGYYNKNPYVYIAAKKAMLSSSKGLTGMGVDLALQDYKANGSLFDALSGFGYVTVSRRFGANRIGTAWTAAYHVSPYSKSAWSKEFDARAAADIIEALREKLAPYLGTRASTTGMQHDAVSLLRRYVSDGVIVDFDITFYKDNATASMGIVYVTLVLTFAAELNTVVVRTALNQV